MDLERHPIFRQTLIYNFIQLDNFPLPGFMSSPAGWQEMSMIDFNHGDFTHQPTWGDDWRQDPGRQEAPRHNPSVRSDSGMVSG